MMIKVAVVSDSHFDRSSRFDECLRIHDWIATDMDERGVDLCLHGGDVYHKLSIPEERTAVGAWLHRVAHSRPVLIVRGNHDAVGDLRVLQYLGTPHPVIVEEASSVHAFTLKGISVQVGAVAWPRASEILAAEGSSGNLNEDAAERMRAIFRGMGETMRGNLGLRVLVMHAMVRGSVSGTGQPLVGCDLEVGLEDIAIVDAHLVVMGHIHKAQDWVYGCPIVYAGSPRRTDFGELEDKSYLLAEFDESGLVRWERVQTPCVKMHHVEWSPGAKLEGPERFSGSEVRLRYRFTAEDKLQSREAVDKLAEQLRAAGASVTIDDVAEPSMHARAPEVALATSTEEKLTAYWNAKGTTPEEADKQRLVVKLHQLEEEHMHGCPE